MAKRKAKVPVKVPRTKPKPRAKARVPAMPRKMAKKLAKVLAKAKRAKPRAMPKALSKAKARALVSHPTRKAPRHPRRVPAIQGAAGYAWFWGTAGSELLGAITTINSVSIAANATGTQAASSLGTNDNSTNSLAFDGLLTQTLKSGQNAYVAAQATGTAGAGTPLTADGEGGIVEIDTAL